MKWNAIMPLLHTASSRRNRWWTLNESRVINCASFDYFHQTHVILRKFEGASMMLPCESNLLCTFVVWLCASAPIIMSWTSGLICFITIWLLTVELRKTHRLTKFYLCVLLNIRNMDMWYSTFSSVINSIGRSWKRRNEHYANHACIRYKITAFL